MFLDAASRNRLRKAAERTEQLAPPGLGAATVDPLRAVVPYHSTVRLTGARIEPGYYPAVITDLDRSTGTFTDRADVTLWVRTPAFAILDEAGIYWGLALGPQLVGTVTRGLYLVDDCCDGGVWACAEEPPPPEAAYNVAISGTTGTGTCTGFNGTHLCDNHIITPAPERFESANLGIYAGNAWHVVVYEGDSGGPAVFVQFVDSVTSTLLAGYYRAGTLADAYPQTLTFVTGSTVCTFPGTLTLTEA